MRTLASYSLTLTPYSPPLSMIIAWLGIWDEKIGIGACGCKIEVFDDYLASTFPDVKIKF